MAHIEKQSLIKLSGGVGNQLLSESTGGACSQVMPAFNSNSGNCSVVIDNPSNLPNITVTAIRGVDWNPSGDFTISIIYTFATRTVAITLTQGATVLSSSITMNAGMPVSSGSPEYLVFTNVVGKRTECIMQVYRYTSDPGTTPTTGTLTVTPQTAEDVIASSNCTGGYLSPSTVYITGGGITTEMLKAHVCGVSLAYASGWSEGYALRLTINKSGAWSLYPSTCTVNSGTITGTGFLSLFRSSDGAKVVFYIDWTILQVIASSLYYDVQFYFGKNKSRMFETAQLGADTEDSRVFYVENITASAKVFGFRWTSSATYGSFARDTYGLVGDGVTTGVWGSGGSYSSLDNMDSFPSLNAGQVASFQLNFSNYSNPAPSEQTAIASFSFSVTP